MTMILLESLVVKKPQSIPTPPSVHRPGSGNPLHGFQAGLRKSTHKMPSYLPIPSLADILLTLGPHLATNATLVVDV